MSLRFSHPLAAGLLALGLMLLVGCSGPKLRLGTLPYPGFPILHKVADPADLGTHRYQSFIGLLDAEQERGIIYTRKGGFVDIAHIRHTTDWTRFVADRVRPALEQDASTLTFDAAWSTGVHLRFDYPPGWDELPAQQRQRLIRELSILIGQRTSHALITWHEVATWWGYNRVPFTTERRSAFTYDDTVSHYLGLEIAARALRDEQRDYNAAVTVALNEVLDEMQAVPPDETRRAIDAVEGWWWNGGAKKRHLDTGYGDDFIHPMLVPGFAPTTHTVTTMAATAAAATSVAPAEARFDLPRVEAIDAHGLDLTGFYHLELEPGIGEWEEAREKLPGHPGRLVPVRDLPRLVDIVRQEMREEIGPNVDLVEPQRPRKRS